MANDFEQELILAFVIGTGIMLLMCISIFLFFKVYQKRAIEAELVQLQMQQIHQRELTAKFIEGEERERTRIARELHDGLGSALWAVKLNLGAVSRGNPLGLTEKQAFQDAFVLVEDSIESLREMAWNLAPPGLVNIGFGKTLREFCRRIRSRTQIEYVESGQAVDLPPEKSLLAFRIAQELLKNALSHSGAAKISVNCLWDTDSLVLTVTDDGVGFDAKSEQLGMGLSNIRHRAEVMGADLFARTEIGFGSRFTLIIKYE